MAEVAPPLAKGIDLAAAYDGESIMIALPTTWWLLAVAAVALSGYVFIGRVVNHWSQYWRQQRRARRRHEGDREPAAAANETKTTTTTTRLVHSTTQTETTWHKSWATPRFGPTPLQGAWVDV